MEIRHIRSFLAVAEELHFSRAAKRVHISQPTLSQHIQLLERDLEVQLINRNSRVVELTPGGQAFLAKARNAMLEFEQARADAQMAAVGRMGSLRVGYSSIASRTVLPGAVAAIEAESSRVHVHLQQLKSGPQLTALRAGELDIALTSGRPLASELSARELHTLQVQVVVTAADPLARRKAVRFVDLRNRRCILFERAQSPMMYDAIAGGATHAGVDLNVAEFVSDGWHANAMVLGRSMVGFATGLGMAADAGRAPGGRQLVNIPLIEPTPRLALHAIWRSSGETSLLMRFVDALATAGAQVRLPTESG